MRDIRKTILLSQAKIELRRKEKFLLDKYYKNTFTPKGRKLLSVLHKVQTRIDTINYLIDYGRL